MNPRVMIIVSLLALILLGACSANRRQADEMKLRAEMLRWQSFRSEGIVEANYMGLALRKFYVAQKNDSELRLDVLDGGIMGGSGSPLLTFYKGEYIAIKSPMMPQLEHLNLDRFFPEETFDKFNSLGPLVDEHKDTILRNGCTVIDSVRVDFTKQLQLSRVKDLRSGAEMNLLYDRGGELDQISLGLDGSMAVKLLVDHMEYGAQAIEPLPRPEKSGLSIFDMFEMQLEDLMERAEDQ